jgi:hypothetical protein
MIDTNYKTICLIVKLNTIEIGARKGLIGKIGVMPARSRHCIREQTQ